MKNFLICLFLSLTCICSYSQSSCEVESDIFSSYDGECKKGLAHGRGVAAADSLSYEGEFRKGYPDGEGILKLRNGNVFKGEFKDGNVYGLGQMISTEGEPLQEGYWKGSMTDFMYMGSDKSALSGYKILADDNLNQAQVRISNAENETEVIRIRLSDPKNRSISGINIDERTSGQIAKSTLTNSRSFIELTSVKFPFIGTLRYSVSNQSGNFSIPVILKVEIIEPGDWTISITH